MKAYTVVGPTNFHPLRFRSFDSATDSGAVSYTHLTLPTILLV